jgi:glucan phosphoethanolaminetransferase (alkaline phosphatase superfamily)
VATHLVLLLLVLLLLLCWRMIVKTVLKMMAAAAVRNMLLVVVWVVRVIMVSKKIHRDAEGGEKAGGSLLEYWSQPIANHWGESQQHWSDEELRVLAHPWQQ